MAVGNQEFTPQPPQGKSLVQKAVGTIRGLFAGGEQVPAPTQSSILSSPQIPTPALPESPSPITTFPQPTTPPKVNVLSPKSAVSSREERIAKYKAEHSSPTITTGFRAAPVAPAKTQEASPAPFASPDIPPSPFTNVKEIAQTTQTLHLSQNELPWIRSSDESDIPLEEITLDGPEGIKFYYGSFIRGNNLENAAQAIQQRNEETALDNLLFTHIADFIRNGRSTKVVRVVDQISPGKIFYIRANNRNRVYFMQFGPIEGKRAIIRVAIADKRTEGGIYKVISKQ